MGRASPAISRSGGTRAEQAETMARVDDFNGLPEEDLRRALGECCSSAQWAEAVAAGRPYPTLAAPLAAADAAGAPPGGGGLGPAPGRPPPRGGPRSPTGPPRGPSRGGGAGD